MRLSVPPTTRCRIANNEEKGAALLIAVLLLGFIMVLSIGASTWGVSAMRGQEQRSASQDEYWAARSAASNVQAYLLSDLPAQYDRDVVAARRFTNGRSFPAFDPATVSAGNSAPVARVNPDSGVVEQSTQQLDQATSLLGQINDWARVRSVLAESYAKERGYTSSVVNVADFYEINRRTFQAGEPAYVLRYTIDARAGRNRVRPSGDLMLGPAMLACNTSVEMRAEPPSIVRGNSTTLTVLYSNASRIVITRSTGETVLDQTVSNQSAAQSLTVSESPNTSLTYQAQALGNGSCSATTPLIGVTVTDPPCPVVNTFTASPSNAQPGQAVTLTWNVSNASDVRIDGTAVAASGSMIVTASATTTYTLTAAGSGNWCPQTAQATVTITPCPRIESFVANPSSITLGQSSTLSWNVSNASGATITLNGNPVGASGSLTVTPAVTTTYTLSVTGPGSCSPQQSSITVQVNPVLCPSIASFTASPNRINEGESTTLTWSVQNSSNASSIRLTGPGVDQLVAASGSLPVVMPSSGNFTFTLDVQSAVPGCGPVSSPASVTVDPIVGGSCPSILSFTAAPSCVLAGGNVVLSWNIQDATNVSINGSGSYPLVGSLTVNPLVSTTYQIDATKPGCSTASRQINVDVGILPTINSFLANPASINTGQQSTLSWNISNALSATINGTPVNPASGTLTVAPPATTNYVLEAAGVGCGGSVPSTVTVSVASCPRPQIQSFTAAPVSILTGQSSTLAWSIANADAGATITLTGPSINRSVAATGSLVVTPPAVPGSYQYRLSVANACDPAFVVEQLLVVNVNACPPPQVATFSATPLTVTKGGNAFVRLQWNVNDPSGTGVNVSISPGVGGSLPQSGFVDITQPQVDTTYTLTVTNGCGTPATAQTTVIVISACSAFSDPLPASQIPSGPEILYLRGRQYVTPCVTDPVFGNSCVFVDTSAAEFAWDTKNADNVTINGIPVPTRGVTSEFVPFVGIRPATFSAHPASDTVFRMEAWDSANPTNRASMEVLIKFVPAVAAGQGPPIITVSNDGINRTAGTLVSIPYDAFVLDSSFNAVRSGVSVDIEGVATGLPAQGTATITAPVKSTDYKFTASYQGRQSIKYVTIIVEDPSNTGPGWQGTGMVPVPGIVSFPSPASVRMRMLSNGAIHIRYIVNGATTSIGGGADPMSGGSVPTPFGGFASGFAEVYKDGIPVAEKVYFGFVPESFQMAGGEVIIPAIFVPNAGCGRVDLKFIGIGSATTGFFSSTESAGVELFDTRTGFVRPDPFGNATFTFVNTWTEVAWQSP